MSDLPRRLRQETADLHAAVEEAVDLPGSVRSRADYVAVLTRLLDLHSPLEARLAVPVWSPSWRALGIDLAVHQRVHLLREDLHALGVPPRAGEARVPALRSFGEAVGCLYVLEGSALGGRVLAPALRAAAGDVPTAFLVGRGRDSARAWQSLRAGLRRAPDALTDDAVRAARAVFTAFGEHLTGLSDRPGRSARSAPTG